MILDDVILAECLCRTVNVVHLEILMLTNVNVNVIHHVFVDVITIRVSMKVIENN